MIQILNTEETSNKILELINNAQEWIVIVSPYIKMKPIYKEAINKKKINVNIVYRKKNLDYKEEDFMFNCKSTSILYCEDSHAKIYMNEKECIISSMNLYDYSQDFNFELSTYINTEEKSLYSKVYKETKRIINSSITEKKSEAIKIKATKIGFCIRTGVKIDFNPKKPFCYEAWVEWNKYKNPNYKEKFCHYSGKPSNGKTSFKNPILED